ncbi:hypothetical protein [Sphingomonas arenae]|uniref:hypothetical protein n=2 Tax=Sphingomonas arenae TaxID=2812555 RepID=UPI0019676093|nr:hypothetical protein [Sphingomonas arenae]
MVTGPFRLLSLMVLLPAAAPAIAKDSKLSIEPVRGLALGLPEDQHRADLTARMKLSDPSTEGLVEPPPFTLQRDGSDLTGKRARLVVPVGDRTRLVASSGKVQRRTRPGDPLALGAGSMGRLESGKQMGAGLERRVGPLEIGAHYQFTRVKGGAIDPTGAASESSADRMMSLTGPEGSMAVPDTESRQRGHSLQATARIRF